MVRKHFIWLRLLSQSGYHMVQHARMFRKVQGNFKSSGQELIANLNPEISGYRSDLLQPSTVELSLLNDILTIVSKLCLLLQSYPKDFRAIHDFPHMGFPHTPLTLFGKPYPCAQEDFKTPKTYTPAKQLRYNFLRRKSMAEMF